MLYWLQHLNKEVSIVSEISSLLLWPNLHSISTFCLIRLVRRGWPWLCLWWHDTHILRCLWSWGHNLRGIFLLSLSFSQLPSGVANLNVWGLFALLGLKPFHCAMAHKSEIRELGLASLELCFKPTCAQVRLTQCRHILTWVMWVEHMVWSQQE